ncbi:MAG: hypothetical protein AB1705_27380, partial [Verrucomicrobiota bacterium]
MSKPNLTGLKVQIEDDDRVEHSLYLDHAKRREFIIQCPLTLTRAELARVQAWIACQLIVEEP